MTSSLLLGLIGDGISASRTPRMHEIEGAAHSIPTIYRTVDIAEPRLAGASLEELLNAAIRLGFDGLNITHPFKQQVIDLLDDVDPVASRIGSVNTVVIDRQGRATGHNTDVTGFAAGFRAGLAGAATEAVVQIGAGEPAVRADSLWPSSAWANSSSPIPMSIGHGAWPRTSGPSGRGRERSDWTDSRRRPPRRTGSSTRPRWE